MSARSFRISRGILPTKSDPWSLFWKKKSWRATHGYLCLIALPFAVMILAQALFELSMLDAGEFTQSVHRLTTTTADGTDQTLNEVAARFSWLTAALLYLVAMACTTFICGSIIARIHGPQRIKPILLVGVAACVILELSMLLGAANGSAMRRGIFDFTYEALPAHLLGHRVLWAVWIIVTAINLLSNVVPVLAILAGVSCVAPPQTGQSVDLPHLAQRMRDLKISLTTGSLLLATGVLHMGAWLHWPTAIVAGKDAARELGTVALSIATFWGVGFSIMALVAFGPADAFLRAKARQLVSRTIESPKEQREWLQDHGFVLTKSQSLREFATLLAPVLAVPFGELFGRLSG